MDDKPMVTPISPGYPPQGGYTPPPSYPQGGYAPPPPPQRSAIAGCFALTMGLGLAFSLLLNLLLLGSKGGGVSGGDSTASGPSGYHEKVIEGEGDAKIVIIRVEGVIAEHQEAGGLFGGGASESLPKKIHDQLEKAKKDAEVKAVLLAVDSPGGTVTASDEIWNELSKFRATASKPLIVHQGALAASGGYYISAAGDEIWASPTTITGSIGVIMQGMNFNKLMKDHGVTDMTITSGPNKALLSPFSEPSDEHRKILQETVDDMYGRFCHVVAEGLARRTAKKEDDVMAEVKKLADGRIYTAKQALDLKLVDKIGYLDEAFDSAKKRAGVTTAKLVRYTKQPSFMDVLSGNMDAKVDIGRGVSIKVDPGVLDELRSPRFLMLWQGE
ncbi:MAG: signal peptide peptidase SppA [Planctomycetota bacterium]